MHNSQCLGSNIQLQFADQEELNVEKKVNCSIPHLIC